jgi:twitching motility protein PilU
MDLTPLFKLMADKKASDLYFSVGAPVNIKIEGVTRPINGQVLEPGATRRIAYSLMTEEQIREFEAAREMNFAHAVPEIGNFRVNVFRQRGDVALVVRYINNAVPTIRELGLPPLLEELVMEKRGLVLAVGSTGSGKSTTLAAMIDHRNTHATGHILTIEDPIEFIFRHKKSITNQREVGADTGSFDRALVNAMREAPDLIMIGEIRDRETMQHAMTYAQTGHLCLSTLHANNSYHALNRIINFFPHDARAGLLLDLSISLKCVLSQRLVKARDGKRIPAMEVLLNTTHIAELIRTGKVDEIKEAMEQSMSPGSQTFEQALYRLYAEGRITLDEAMANADSPTNLSWLINNAGGKPAPERQAIRIDENAEKSELEGFSLSPDMLDKL